MRPRNDYRPWITRSADFMAQLCLLVIIVTFTAAAVALACVGVWSVAKGVFL